MTNESNITVLQVYERLVQLETKIDLAGETGRGTTSRFKQYVYVVVGLIVLDIVLELLRYVLPWAR